MTVLVLLAMVSSLTACGSDRPVYSGHEESTAGVPGFSPDGSRKLHPNVKLGQSYRVGGTTYVPRYQPEYDETGMASWYGPGFHGGKTANGEKFSTHDYTAAHTTLPLPSIVKVTYLKTGRSAYVRINDRGPFAHGRIIDLSRAAAEDIGLIKDGVGKVRVQYMPQETEKFVSMIVTGRDPASIDIAHEVVGQAPDAAPVLYADTVPPDESVQVSDMMPLAAAPPPAPTVWQQVSPIPTAQAAEAPPIPTGSIPPPQQLAAPILTPIAPGAALPTPTAMPPQQLASLAPAGGMFVQLGAYSNQSNAITMQQRFAAMGGTQVMPVTNASGATLYRVRLGPFANEQAAAEILERAKLMGIGDAKLVLEQP